MAQMFCSRCQGQSLLLKDISSPVPELLSTNGVSLIQTQAIKQCLIDVDSNIQLLEDGIRKMQDAINKLEAQKESLKALAKEHRALLSPARRLYPELLSEIFTFFVHSNLVEFQDTYFWEIKDNFNPNYGPLLLTRVCRSWRIAAIAFPELWTVIRFVVKPRRRFNLMNMWLERSGACNLIIAILDDANAYNAADFAAAATAPCNQEALRLVSSQAHRWKSARFHLPRFKECWDAFAAANGHATQLERLDIRVTRPAWHDDIPDMIPDGSQLAHLSLAHCNFPTPRPSIGGSGITHLYYTVYEQGFPPIPIDTLLDGLLCLPNLEWFVLGNGGGFAPMQNPFARVVSLPKLSVLRIAQIWAPNVQFHGMTELWQALRLPNLVELKVLCQPLYVVTTALLEWAHLPFLCCISRCSKLQHLTLSSSSLQQEDLIEVFQHTPSVTELRFALSGTAQTRELFDHLAARSTLPRLSKFEIVFFNASALSQGFLKGLFQTVKNRMEAGAKGHVQLRSAHLQIKARYAYRHPTIITNALPFIRSMMYPSDGIRARRNSDTIMFFNEQI